MEKLVLIIMLFVVFPFLNLKAYSESFEGWLSIDSGGDDFRVGPNIIPWYTDEDFTQTGSNKRVPQPQPLEEMNSLRYFPDRSQRNCYNLPVYIGQRYLLRAGFYYGNYDGLSKPPTFDLEFDSEKWVTVNTSVSQGPIYHEAIYVTKDGGLDICFIQNKDDEVPFISSLETVPLWDDLYPKMGSKATFHLATRTNFGGEEIRFSGVDVDELYNRIWTSTTAPPNCVNKSTIPYARNGTENNPPYAVLSSAVIAENASDSIVLTIDVADQTPRPAYFVFYFVEVYISNDPKDVRQFQISIDGTLMGDTVRTSFETCQVITFYPVNIVGPTTNITLSPVAGSSLPPMINAMEIFTRTEVHQSKKSSSHKHDHFFFAYLMLINVLSLVLIL